MEDAAQAMQRRESEAVREAMARGKEAAEQRVRQAQQMCRAEADGQLASLRRKCAAEKDQAVEACRNAAKEQLEKAIQDLQAVWAYAVPGCEFACLTRHAPTRQTHAKELSELQVEYETSYKRELASRLEHAKRDMEVAAERQMVQARAAFEKDRHGAMAQQACPAFLDTRTDASSSRVRQNCRNDCGRRLSKSRTEPGDRPRKAWRLPCSPPRTRPSSTRNRQWPRRLQKLLLSTRQHCDRRRTMPHVTPPDCKRS